jgi:translation initiation factor 1 (eIF-1/SUI1)
MSFARHLKRTGRIALLIEGDDGTHLDRKNLAKELHREASA